MEDRSPAQVFALVIGVTLVAAGILGFFYSASFSTGDGTEREALLGILDLGAVYLLVTLLGFIAGDGEVILNLIPVNTEDNFLHLLIGIAGIAAGLATPAHDRLSASPA
jgi:4-hydroxybenzoate polyprenyltransferase